MAALGGKVMGDDDVQGSLAVGPRTGFACSRDETPEQLFTLFSLKNGNQSWVQSQGERRFSAGLRGSWECLGRGLPSWAVTFASSEHRHPKEQLHRRHPSPPPRNLQDSPE